MGSLLVTYLDKDLSQPLLDEATSPIASTEPLISVSVNER
ncbi:hypothetical protein T01_3123 [Trichinella spiralis]|uniref:Uncharacterized protein n=1 Tax=Trichinella spiralis TaxID=6334 RepID=A0A0V1BH14_TRISP|nr:hypothetical protein T01_3123 [Trichinella spiralis]